MGFAGEELVVPDYLTAVGIQRQGGIGVKCIAVGTAHGSCPGLGLGSAVINQSGSGIIAPGNPGIGTGAKFRRKVSPGVAPRCTGQGDGVGTPQLFAAVGIVPGNKTDITGVAFATIDAGDHHTIGDDRPGHVSESHAGIGGGGFPYQQTAAGIDGPDAGVLRRGENLVTVDGDVFLHTTPDSGVGSHRQGSVTEVFRGDGNVTAIDTGGDAVTVFPDEIAAVCFNGVNDAARSGDVHDTVVD